MDTPFSMPPMPPKKKKKPTQSQEAYFIICVTLEALKYSY